MPLGFFPKSLKQVKVAEKQVDVRPIEKSIENVCLGRDVNVVQVLPTDKDDERKEMHVEKLHEGLESQVESLAGEELPRDSFGYGC